MTNIEKIKDMMSNELWMDAIDSVTELIITAADLQEEVDALKEQNEALIKERDRLTNVVHKQGSEIINLRAKNYDLKAKIKESVDTITINPCLDLEEAYSPDNNTIVNIKNLYLTNNYISEEDENNGDA